MTDLPKANDRLLVQIGMGWSLGRVGHGSDRYFHGLLHALRARGETIAGLVVGEDETATLSDGMVEAVAPPSAGLLARRRAMAAAVRERLRRAPDAQVVSHFAAYASPLRTLGRQAPHTVHFHGPWAAESEVEGAGRLNVRAKRWLERRVYRSAGRLITLSQAFADLLVRTYGVDESRVRVIPGGIEPAAWNPPCDRGAAREQLGWPTDRPILLCVRRLSNRMGVPELLRATRRLVDRRPDLLVVVGGKGPLADSLADLTESLSLTDHVRFTGFLPEADLPVAYRAADLTVTPSQALEGFGLVVLESLAAGTPALVTPVGGMPEVVADLDPGLIAADKTPDALAEAADRLLEGGTAAPPARSCQAYVAERFDWSPLAERISAVYNECYVGRRG